MQSGRKYARLIFVCGVLLFGSTEAFSQTAPVKRIFFSEFADKLKPRGEYVEDVFRKKLTEAGYRFVKDAKRADAILSIAIEQRSTLMAEDDQTQEIFKFRLTNARGRRMWQSETIIKDYRAAETAARELLRVLKNKTKRTASRGAKNSYQAHE